MMCSASLSCGPQSHFNEPNTSPVRHSLCSRTSGGLPANAPTTRATCSCPSSEARKATICVGGMSSSGSFARATISTDGLRSLPLDVVDRHAKLGHGRIEQPQCRQQPGGAGEVERGAAVSTHSGVIGCSGPIGARSRSRPGIGDRERARSVEPVGMADHHRRARIGGIAFVGQVERRRPLAADQQFAPTTGIDEVEQLLARGLDRQRPRSGIGPSIRIGRPARSAAIAAPDGVAAQTSISTISGTWSDGRSQLRHGSSTACAFKCPASSGEAHIWSSLRPRSFFVQSGER